MKDMFDITTPTGRRWPSSESDVQEGLNWLLRENRAEIEGRATTQLVAEAQEEVQMMRRPLSAEEAYAFLGLLLGLLPPAAIFYRAGAYALTPERISEPAILFLCLGMNLICLIVGGFTGKRMGRWLDSNCGADKKVSRLDALAAGIGWGAITGGAGGAFCFIFGAVAGALCAIPVGIAGFVTFTILHRLVARGGMIDARHFWPLACGVTMTIAALILGR